MQLRDYGRFTDIEADNVYGNVLYQTFNRLQIQPKKRGSILSVACGRLHEGLVISEFFNTQEVYAVDISRENIKDAKENNPHIPERNIRVGDARNLQENFRDKFDCIFLRHPNPSEDIKMWKKILQSTIKALKEDGLLILTTFTLSELQIILKMLIFMGIKIPMVTDNKHPHELMKMFDAYICVIQKGRLIGDFKQRVLTLTQATNLPDVTSMDRAIRSLRRIH